MSRIVWNSIGTSRLTQWDRDTIEMNRNPGDDGSGRSFAFEKNTLWLIQGDGERINVARLARDDEPQAEAERNAVEARIAAEAAVPPPAPTEIPGVQEALEHADAAAYIEHLKLEILELQDTCDRMQKQNSAINQQLAVEREARIRERDAYQLELHNKAQAPAE